MTDETTQNIARLRAKIDARTERSAALMRAMDSELADAEDHLRRGSAFEARQCLRHVRNAIGIVLK